MVFCILNYRKSIQIFLKLKFKPLLINFSEQIPLKVDENFLEFLQPFSETATRGVLYKKKPVLKNFATTGNNCYGVLFLIKLQTFKPATKCYFLILCFLMQIYYFKNSPNVTVISQIISTPNLLVLFYLTLK